MLKHVILGAACLAAGQAFAGGPVAVTPEPTVVPVAAPAADFDWTGLYVGAFGGSGEFGYGSPSNYAHFGVHVGYLRDFGNLVLGGELAYMTGEQDEMGDLGFASTRLKLIGGLGSGRVMPYAFVGASNFSADYGPVTFTDSFTIYGLGAKIALGTTGRHAVGLEYLVETTNDFNDFGSGADNSEISIRYDFRF